jgi:small subunit ribosomal protein S6
MKNYELICILDPQIGDARFSEVAEKYEKYLKSSSAEVAHIDHWGLRKLAYSSASLKKRQQGYYVLFQFAAEPPSILALERELSLDEEVLRHLVVSTQGEFIRVPQLLPESALFPERPSRDNGRFRRDNREGQEAPSRSTEEPAREGGETEAAPSVAAAEPSPAPEEGDGN